MAEELAPMLAVIALIVAAAVVLRTQLQSRLQRDLVEKQTSVQRHLLDRFESPQELANYLQSESGQKFLEVPSVEKGSSLERVLGSVRAGILMTALGIAFYVLRGSIDAEARQTFAVLGGLALALGIGSLFSATATWFLSKRWGLLNGADS